MRVLDFSFFFFVYASWIRMEGRREGIYQNARLRIHSEVKNVDFLRLQ